MNQDRLICKIDICGLYDSMWDALTVCILVRRSRPIRGYNTESGGLKLKYLFALFFADRPITFCRPGLKPLGA
jgi:hypothetical protein